MLALKTSKSEFEIPVTAAPLKVILPFKVVPPASFDQDAVATVGSTVLSTAADVLVTVLAGALLLGLPSDRTLVAFNRSLNEVSVFAGGVAVTVINPPDVADELEILIDQPVVEPLVLVKTSKSELPILVTAAPLNVILPDNVAPPLIFDQAPVATV